MKIKSSESTRVYRTEGGGCSLILAIPMVAIGVSLLYFGILALYRSNKEPIIIGVSVVAILFGALILSIAIPIVSTRRGVTLDRIQGTASEWRKIFGHHKTVAVHNLNEFRSIEIFNHKEPKRTTTHIVQLTGDSKKITLCHLGAIGLVQENASDASTFLSIPVVDKTNEEMEEEDGSNF